MWPPWRTRVHAIRRIFFQKSFPTTIQTLIYEKKAEIAEQIQISEENLEAILDGMLSVTSDGTASSVFEDYPVSVLGKSGSAQVADGSANAIFVLAAPAQSPTNCHMRRN